MERPTGMFVVLSVVLVVLAAACTPRVGGEDTYTATVVLPSLERCLYADEGGMLVFDGERLSWTCESPVDGPRGLFGAPIVSAGVDVRWRLVATERAVDGGGYVIAREEMAHGRAERLVLSSGETCFFAGEGATLAFDQGRVNYTCGDDVVVVGALQGDARGLVAVSGALVRADEGEPFRLSDPRPTRVTAVTLE